MEDMEKNENLETEELQDGIDQNGQQEKMFTQEQVNEIVRKRLAKVKQQEGTEPPEDYTAKVAELTAKESHLSCREYVIERRYPKELLETLDTSDVENFKEKADMLQEIYGRKSPQPFGSAEFDGYGDGPVTQAFSYGRKHKPDKRLLGISDEDY